ncbi:MAG: hypothetical protein H6765_03965 [Candidatus Peribacteria bacterium]|nr:MAG: hypothetical protein H6765_03965 [Candidatus Peribacteria bacterium]
MVAIGFKVDVAHAQPLLDPQAYGQFLETNAASNNTIKNEMIELFELTLQILHLIMRPLLAIAGASMDNSLIYGSIFYLDRALWKFWNIIRTFANFAV